MGSVPVAVLGAAVPVVHEVAAIPVWHELDPSAKIVVVGPHAGVDDVDVEARRLVVVRERVVERQVGLVDAVEAPTRGIVLNGGYLGVAVGLDVEDVGVLADDVGGLRGQANRAPLDGVRIRSQQAAVLDRDLAGDGKRIHVVAKDDDVLARHDRRIGGSVRSILSGFCLRPEVAP